MSKINSFCRAARGSALGILSAVVCGLAAAQPAVADCETVPGNDLPHCGFEAGNPPTGWSVESGDQLAQHATARSGSAAGAIDASDLGAGLFIASAWSDCFPIASGPNYGFGAFFRAAAPASPACNVGINLFTDPGCAPSSGTGSASTSYIVPNDTSWTLTNGTLDATGSVAGRLRLYCAVSGGADFTILLDDAFAGPGMVPVELLRFVVE